MKEAPFSGSQGGEGSSALRGQPGWSLHLACTSKVRQIRIEQSRKEQNGTEQNRIQRHRDVMHAIAVVMEVW